MGTSFNEVQIPGIVIVREVVISCYGQLLGIVHMYLPDRYSV